MGIEWYVSFVHPDQSFQANRQVFEETKQLLSRLGEPGIEQVANPDGTVVQRWSSGLIMPIEDNRDCWASFENSDDVPFCSCRVTCYAEPTQCVDNDSDTYTTTFEVTFTFDANTDLAPEPRDVIEQEIRKYARGVLEQIEQRVGTKLVMKQRVEG
jgi:hypothetical protein